MAILGERLKGANNLNFMEIAYALADISDTGSTLAKEEMLRKLGKKVEGFKSVLKFIYDPYFTTGIGKKKLD